MKPVLLFFSLCFASFCISLFFAMQTHAESTIQIYASQTPPPQENSGGVVLSAFTASSGTSVSNSFIQNDPLGAFRAIPHTGTFFSLLDNAGVASQLSTSGRNTFFIPTNEAFAHASHLTYLSPADKLRLVQYHIVPGEMISLDSLKYGHMTMLSRDELNVGVFETVLIEANSHVVGTYRIQNNIIYMIDIVLLPPEKRPFPF